MDTVSVEIVVDKPVQELEIQKVEVKFEDNSARKQQPVQSDAARAQTKRSSERPSNAPSRPARKLLPFLDEIKAKKRLASPIRQKTFIKELAAIHRTHAILPKTSATTSFNTTVESSPMEEDVNLGQDQVLKIGTLIKTSQTRGKKANPGPSRQRKFRLTSESLDYLHTFSHVKVKRGYPLTAVEGVEYDNHEHPLVFRLNFSTYTLTLQAESEDEARDWVQKINEAWSMWKVSPGEDNGANATETMEMNFDEDARVGGAGEDEENWMPFPDPSDDTAMSRERVSSSSSNKKFRPTPSRPRSNSSGPSFLRRESRDSSNDLEGHGTYDSRKNSVTRRAFRIARLKPHLERTHQKTVHDPERDDDPAQNKLHKEFSMIKYPNKILRLPAERVFIVDRDNLQILWRTTTKTGYRQKSSLSLRRIVEVRKGQQTPQFDKFPYEQVEEQSFSLLFESENNKYAKLASLDIICDHKDSFNEWMEGLDTLVSSTQWLNLFPPRYENSDPTILWLKQIWACKAENHELKQHDAIKLAKKFLPTLTQEEARTVVKVAHGHQFKYTFNYGAALRWDGFVLMFYLLCDRTNLQLHKVFLKYAKQHPNLGLTVNEFRRFLVQECHWLPADTKRSLLLSLIRNHDEEHHQSIKKFCAGNKPQEYQIALKLLSFAGLLSFLRSKDNSIIDLDHETVYQDMTQPLSHYFINSSHNTYLEGDQLTGTSSTDAYVRALLQGCRCVEIDCWDDVLNVNGLPDREPVIYHGHTLTTKVAFRDVIHAINDYGFSSSLYPIIISIENHCSSSQQSKMAKIFRAIFAERLPVENLVEFEGREHLPSPQELQGKVILKGSFKAKKVIKTNKKFMKKIRSQALVAQTYLDPESSLPQVSPSSTPTRTRKAFPDTTSSPPTQGGSGETGDHPDGPSGSLFEEDLSEGRARFRRRSVRLRVLRNQLQQREQGQDDQELGFTETAQDLKDLIVYCHSVTIKPWDWKKQKETMVSEMFSFGEPTALVLCKNCPKDVLCCTERQLVRTYPKGTRFDSSNYDPILMWNCGVQMVALNFQYPGIEMHLNQGFFRQNGGCGYVLKPELMRREDPGGTGDHATARPGGRAPYNPDMMVPHPHVSPIQLEIELLSGQRLSSWKKKCNFLTVDIQTYGITHDTDKMKQASHTNSFWPTWEKGEHVFKHQILMPELCLVYFRVENENHKIYGQNCFPLISLVPGIKFVPLRTNGGEIIPESGLFIRIDKFEGEESENEKQSLKARAMTTILEECPFDDLATCQDIEPHFALRGKGDASPRPLTSPPVMQIFKFQPPSRAVKDKEPDASVLSGGENEVVLNVEIHPNDGETDVTITYI